LPIPLFEAKALFTRSGFARIPPPARSSKKSYSADPTSRALRTCWVK
jgi:hypothetical protein